MQSITALLFAFASTAYAVPGQSNSGNICNKSPFNALVPILSAYAPAQSYCASKFPRVASITTITTTVPECIATAAPAAVKRDADLDTKLSERDSTARKKAMASLLACKQNIIATACSCMQAPTPVTSTVTSTGAFATPLPSCCNNAPYAQIRQSGSDLYGVCTDCTYSAADGQYTFEAYPFNTNCDFVQYCTNACEKRGDACQGVTEQIPDSNAYPNCQFLANAVGGGSVAADSDTIYRLPAGVPLCAGTQISPAECACNGGGDCVPV